MKTLLKYDFFYLKRTSKFIIIPAIAIFFAILSPATAKYMPEILEALVGSEGLDIVIPPVTVLDSYVQYIGNLYELFLIVIVFMGVSIFMRQKNKGELPLVLSKPINRAKYLLSKYTTFSLLILLALVVGGLVFGYYTYFLFETVDLLITLYISLIFLVYVLFILSIAMITSMFFNSYAGASIVTFVSYLVFSILSTFDKGLLEYLPGRLSTRIAEVITDSTDHLVWTNILVSLLLTGVLLFVSIKKFNTYDIN